jgi:hypothetical protein
MAVCKYCGLEAVVTITSDNKHTYTYPVLECRWLQEQASRLGAAPILEGQEECPHTVKAVDEEVNANRGE